MQSRRQNTFPLPVLCLCKQVLGPIFSKLATMPACYWLSNKQTTQDVFTLLHIKIRIISSASGSAGGCLNTFLSIVSV